MTPVHGVFQSNADTRHTKVEDDRCEDRYDEAERIRIMPDGSDLAKGWALLHLHREY
jgi:hypothetical protein